MPESPDFDQIAAAIADEHQAAVSAGHGFDAIELTDDIAEQLRRVWNARGAADAKLFAGEIDERDVSERIATLDR